ncbi:MAG: hypothetical protein A2Z83_08590 [Omnitrophica bacterium GWA2_52_8]|nr:MAG: hypothetical protein A2Z83_08590 [Omnitrophica bacterium GWA2_52_8]
MNESAAKARAAFKVLLVEDDPAEVQRIRQVLSRGPAGISYEVSMVPRLEEALQYPSASDIDIVLLDQSLPDASGPEVFQSMAEKYPLLPVVILAAAENAAEALSALGRGAQDYLVKAHINAHNLHRIIAHAVERKRIQCEIRIAEEKYRSIFENSAVAITVCDTRQILMSWNKFTEDMLRLAPEDLKDKPVEALYPPASWNRIQQAHLRQKGWQHRLEVQMIRKDGHLIDVDLSLSALKDPSGEVMGTIAVIRDITEQKALERLKDEFVSTVSHELRTPMTIIREGVAQVMEGMLGEITEQQKGFLAMSLDNIDRLTRMVTDLLDISKIESGKIEIRRQRFDLVQLVIKSCKIFETAARERQIEVRTAFEKPVMEVYADYDKLMQVFQNLIGNGLKFIRKGHVQVSVRDKGDYLECSVEDTGPGINDEDLPFVFQKFKQFGKTKGIGQKGTGLGLAISKGIIEMHYGRIWVDTRAGRGTSFTFTIPKFSLPKFFQEQMKKAIQEARRSGMSLSWIVFQTTNLELMSREIRRRQMDISLRRVKTWLDENLKQKSELVSFDDRAMLLAIYAMQKEEGLMVAGRIRQCLEESLKGSGGSKEQEFHCRVITYPDDGPDTETLLSKIGMLENRQD